MHIDAITVGERRREDLGDIDGLQASIGRVGLIQPIVVDDAGRLVAGGRRLEACRRLGLVEVETRCAGTLTEAERRDLELEENLWRKDLTPYERAKTMVLRSENAKAILQAQAAAFADLSINQQTSGRGGANARPDSQRQVARYLGVSQGQLSQAYKYVAAVDEEPALLHATAESVKRGQPEAPRGRGRPASRPAGAPRARVPRAPARPRPLGSQTVQWLKDLKTFRERWATIGKGAGLRDAIAVWSESDRAGLGRELEVLSDELATCAAALQAERTNDARTA